MTPPTKNTNGTAITGYITYDIYQGAWGQEKLVRANWPLKSWVADPATLNVRNARICWRIKAKVKGVASKYSADKCKWFF